MSSRVRSPARQTPRAVGSLLLRRRFGPASRRRAEQDWVFFLLEELNGLGDSLRFQQEPKGQDGRADESPRACRQHHRCARLAARCRARPHLGVRGPRASVSRGRLGTEPGSRAARAGPPAPAGVASHAVVRGAGDSLSHTVAIPTKEDPMRARMKPRTAAVATPRTRKRPQAHPAPSDRRSRPRERHHGRAPRR